MTQHQTLHVNVLAVLGQQDLPAQLANTTDAGQYPVIRYDAVVVLPGGFNPSWKLLQVEVSASPEGEQPTEASFRDLLVRGIRSQVDGLVVDLVGETYILVLDDVLVP